MQIEDNKFALTVHTRNVSEADAPKLDALLGRLLEELPLLRRSEGKDIIELRPQVRSPRRLRLVPARVHTLSARRQPTSELVWTSSGRRLDVV